MAFLEKSLGSRLLHPSSRSLGLTSASSGILPYCRQILPLSDEMDSVTEGKNAEPPGLIWVASRTSFGQSYLAEALCRVIPENTHRDDSG